MNDIQQIINEYSQKKFKEQISFNEIRNELKKRIEEEKTINKILEEIDRLVLIKTKNKQVLQEEKSKMIIGLCLMGIAGVISILIFSKLIHINNKYLLYSIFIPLLIGYFLFVMARKKIKIINNTDTNEDNN